MNPKINTIQKNILLPCFAFAQIYGINGFGKYKMHGNVINVPINVNWTQFILPLLPYDEEMMGLFFKWCMEYK